MNEMETGDRNKAFARHVKRRVIGQEHRLAVIVPPELVQVCLGEMQGLGIPSPEATPAGLEFTGKLKDAYACNLWLRTASRVLCRLPPFRAGIAEELFFKVSRIPWEVWIDPAVAVAVEAHVAYSRVGHEGKTAEAVYDGMRKAIERHYGAGAGLRLAGADSDACPAAGGEQKVLVHLARNQCRISLDTTGRHLHERGYRLEHAGAPLRETLAAAILLRSGWDGRVPLVDGMCGSGTFPIEAARIARRIAPGRGRRFLFEGWPSFREKTWEYLCRHAAENVLDRAPAPIFGIDSDPEAVRVCGENGRRADVAGDIEWREADFFDFDPRSTGLEPGMLVLNPPYGKRLGGGGKEFYERLGGHLRRHYAGWSYAVLAPSRREMAAMGPGPMRSWSIRHGGIPVTVGFGRVRA